jgi:hypothetical protein
MKDENPNVELIAAMLTTGLLAARSSGPGTHISTNTDLQNAATIGVSLYHEVRKALDNPLLRQSEKFTPKHREKRCPRSLRYGLPSGFHTGGPHVLPETERCRAWPMR